MPRGPTCETHLSGAARGAGRITRRRLLVLTGGTAASALLASSGIAHASRGQTIPQAVAAVLASRPQAAAPTMAPLAGFQQATQMGFAPINSTLTFGPPADLGAGWDGTLWAIDSSGAPHVYNPLSDNWQLHGTGVDGAALINDAGPAVYFRGGEVFVADGSGQGAQPIATLWPQLPPSYQLGVQGAAWTGDKLVLFRGGTYPTVPWISAGSLAAPEAPTMAAAGGARPVPRRAAGCRPDDCHSDADAERCPHANRHPERRRNPEMTAQFGPARFAVEKLSAELAMHVPAPQTALRKRSAISRSARATAPATTAT